jgi:hypothetical protein
MQINKEAEKLFYIILGNVCAYLSAKRAVDNNAWRVLIIFTIISKQFIRTFMKA